MVSFNRMNLDDVPEAHELPPVHPDCEQSGAVVGAVCLIVFGILIGMVLMGVLG